jgi:D-3-phosphoglycerate dehydrogenase
MRPLAYDVVEDDSFRPVPEFRYVPLSELLAAADVVSLHCAAPPDGSAMLDAAALEQMKTGVLVVNTARGALIDEAAMLRALDSGRVGGLAMDVFHAEPPGDNPLVKHDRVIATPHVGSLTVESVDRAVTAAVDNLLAELSGAADAGNG